MIRHLVFTVVLLLNAAALAATPDALPDGGSGPVKTVFDADTLRLEGGTADVRLVGIQTPKLPLGRKGFEAWPLSPQAHRTLIDLVQGHRLTLRLGATPKDRNGRILAHVMRDDGLWIQAEMLRLGFARVYTFPDNRQLTAELFAAERDARAAKRGIWAEGFYTVRTTDPAKLAKDTGTFQVVEGRVAETAKVAGRVYLNFGEDYRTDFTASIAPEAMPMFTKAKIDLLALKGKVIRVRGYIRSYNGPVIDVTHPEQIEADIAP